MTDHRFLTKCYVKTSEGTKELASFVVYTDSPVKAHRLATDRIRQKVWAECLGEMGPLADDNLHDEVIRED